MKTRNLYIGLLLLSLPFLQGLQCDKDVEPQPVEYEHNFKETATLSPYRLEYAVGDTIWLQVHIQGKKLLDENTGTRILFDSALFKSFAQAQLLFSDPFLGDGPFVHYIFPKGNFGIHQ